MADLVPAARLTDIRSLWGKIGKHQIRKLIADELGVHPTNLDQAAGIEMISGLFPSTNVRKSQAAKEFTRNMLRHGSLVDTAAELALLAPYKKPAKVGHLLQASVVLGMGSFDAYIRSFTIQAYLDHLFGKDEAPKEFHSAWTRAAKAAIDSEPDLLIEVAKMEPKMARPHLAEAVFAAHQVRILTSVFQQAVDNLKSCGISGMSVHPNSVATTRTDQLLQVAPSVFDAFANARHIIVHTGTAASQTTGPTAAPYCANQFPAQMLGPFLDALVTIVETKWDARKPGT